MSSLQDDLVVVAGPGGPDAVAVAQRLAAALGPALGLRLLEALGLAAEELGGQLPAGHVEVRLVGREPGLVYVPEPALEAAEPADGGADDAATARLTLRLPEPLKARIEVAADADGVSTNTWLVRAAARALDTDTRQPGRGRRLRGHGIA